MMKKVPALALSLLYLNCIAPGAYAASEVLIKIAGVHHKVMDSYVMSEGTFFSDRVEFYNAMLEQAIDARPAAAGPGGSRRPVAASVRTARLPVANLFSPQGKMVGVQAPGEESGWGKYIIECTGDYLLEVDGNGAYLAHIAVRNTQGTFERWNIESAGSRQSDSLSVPVIPSAPFLTNLSTSGGVDLMKQNMLQRAHMHTAVLRSGTGGGDTLLLWLRSTDIPPPAHQNIPCITMVLGWNAEPPENDSEKRGLPKWLWRQ